MSIRQRHAIVVRTLYPLLIVALVLAASISVAPQSVAQAPVGTWIPTGSMSLPRSGHTATLLSNGRVLVAGGKSGDAIYLSSAELYDPATGTWSLTGSMGGPRSGHTATLLPDGRVLVAGGWNGAEQLSSAELYDPATGTWSSTGSMGGPRSDHTATPLNYVPLWEGVPAGNLAMSGASWEEEYHYSTIQTADIDGDGAAELLARRSDGLHTYRFNTGTQMWEGVPAGNLGMSGASWEQEYHYGTIQTADIDGDGAAELLARRSVGLFTYKFNTGTQKWEYIDAGNLGMSNPGWQADYYYRTIQTADIDGDGAAELLARRSVGLFTYKFNTGTQMWEGVPAGNLAMSGASWEEAYHYSTIQTADIDGDGAAELLARRSDGLHTYRLSGVNRVLVAGGRADGSRFSSAELYDPATGTWSPTDSMSDARSGHTATPLRTGRVLVAGGDGASTLLSSAELYDPVTRTWSSTGGMSDARTEHTATLLSDGRVLVIAGRIDPIIPWKHTELYSPVTGTWSSAADITVARIWFHTSTLLPSGHVLMAGGIGGDPSDHLSGAELYDPVTDAWTLTASMSTSRSGHTATLLPDGRVLVAGGWNNTGELSSAELFEPTTHIYLPLVVKNAWPSRAASRR